MSGRFIYPVAVFILFFCWSFHLSAQQPDTLNGYSNMRTRTIAVDPSDTLYLDEHSLYSGSLSIKEVADSSYELYPLASFLVWKKRPEQDSITLNYRVLPFSFSGKKYHKSDSLLQANAAFPAPSYSYTDSNARGFVNFNTIDYNGTYGRSLTIGNSQDVSLNSNFNLQLNGYILDSVRIEAAITDNNLPIQPDGNTQQLQEFDQVYITFEKGRHKLTAGDHNLERPASYFVNFNKRVQGILYEAMFPDYKSVQNHLVLGGSIAKGQFARNIIFGVEGNQGPYKLTGNNGEQFFIVLAGTEKVYIDGILMERGEDRDYVINYNTGEVTFMPRRLITKDKRIQFEFEYQDRNYLNSLLYAYDNLKIGDKWNVRLVAYSNQDARNQPYMQSLSAEQKIYLAGIGDDIDRAYYQSAREDTFAANKILYKLTDTTVNGIFYDSVFVYSTNKDSAKYALGFSYVGENKGNYIIAGTNTNGRSYSWIAPVSGAPQGNYEPVVLLITPKKQQLFTIGTTYQLDSFKKVDIELGASNYAPNLFSDIDKDKHWGVSARGVYDETRFLGKKDSLGRTKVVWKNNLSYEFVQSRFKAIAPYRNVEFARDWNIASDAPSEDEHLVGYNTELNIAKTGSLNYSLTWYGRGTDYRANRNIASLQLDRNNWKGGVTFNLMHSSSPVQNSKYFRPSLFLEKRLPGLNDISVGAAYEKEQNDIRFAPADTLLPTAFAFDVLRFYIRTNGERKTKVEFNYTLREDEGVTGNQFTKWNTGHTLDATIGLYQIKNQQVKLTGSYRNLIVDNQQLPGPEAGETILGRVEYTGNISKGFIVPSFLYEIGSGQEQKRIYTYVEVPVGQGMYMWVDYNNDGVQQANEFEPAIYPDQKKYIRIITPTNEYMKVNYVQLNSALMIEPENLWLRKTGKKKWQTVISRFSDQLSLQVNNRTLSAEGIETFNPFNAAINDTNIISSLAVITNTFFFNRNSAIWGGEYTFAHNAGKSLLTYGLEGNMQNRHQLKMRSTFYKSYTLSLQVQELTREYQSALADGRTYRVGSKALEPSLTWLLRSQLRITGGYKWDSRENAGAYGGEKALIQSLNIDARSTWAALGTMQARLTYADIRFDGQINTSLAFVMLDALQKGSNWLWYLSWDRRLSKGIELSLEYEGRKPGNSPVIHTGRMSIRAVL